VQSFFIFLRILIPLLLVSRSRDGGKISLELYEFALFSLIPMSINATILYEGAEEPRQGDNSGLQIALLRRAFGGLS
jgi:hypothetical protein